MSESKNKLINHAQIHWSDQSEPISALFDDVYFNTEQGIDESFYVFFQGNQLAQRWLTCQSEHFVIAETGFGTGLNFLVCCAHFQQFLREHPQKPLKRLLFTSFEKYPLNKQDLTNALQRWPSLKAYIGPLINQYPLALTGCHRILFEQFNITLDLWFGDVQQTLPTLYHHDLGLFDCWFLDGFAPSKNPEMWSEQLFKEIADSCKSGASIATFTAAGFVRRGLIAAGFNMHKRKGYGKKREMLVGQLTTKINRIQQEAKHFRQGAQTDAKDVAIIGAGIASACLSLALVKRGYKVTVYCKNTPFAEGTSGNQQAALYPLLNREHNTLGQFFANSFLYARNYVGLINQFSPFEFDFSGLQQPYSAQTTDKNLESILQAQLPEELVQKHHSEQSSLYYKLAGSLNPKQMQQAIFKKAEKEGELTIKINKHLDSFCEDKSGWKLQFSDQDISHSLLILTTAINTLPCKQCKALALSPAHKQATQYSKIMTHFSMQNKCSAQNADSGICCTTDDYFPYAGALANYQITQEERNTDNAPFYNNLFLLAGLGMHGLCTAPLLSEMLASQINKEPLPFTTDILNVLQTNRHG